MIFSRPKNRLFIAIGVLSLVPPCFGVSLMQEDPQTIQQTRWQLSLNGGWMYPLNSKAVIPPLGNRIVMPNQFGGDFRATSKATELTLGGAASFGGSLLYAFQPWVSVGAFGGASTSFVADATPQEMALDVRHYGYDGSVANTFEDGFMAEFKMKLARFVPVVRMGPWCELGSYAFKPFVTAGAGWYRVNQSMEFHLSPNQWNWPVYSESNDYLGGLVGGGLLLTLPGNGSVSLEAQYEHIFSPGPTLQFFTPMLEFSYHFGGKDD